MLRRMPPSTSTRVCFVIPTYDEAANITPLLERLTTLYAGGDIAIVIVDDHSPDGTGRLVRDFAAADPRVHLLEGPKRGLGHAYVRGMRHALDVLGAETIVQMDADFSHDPAAARRLIDRLAAGVDVAIGSRYVAGRGIAERWSLRRRLMSGWGNHLTRWVAGLRHVRDCTAGFRAIRAAALRAAGVGGVSARGYAFNVVLLHRLTRSGAHIVEAPIFFRERDRGRTKLGWRDIVECLLVIWQLRFVDLVRPRRA